MSDDERKIQEKQLFAQRAQAVATAVNAAATAQLAATAEQTRRQMEASAEHDKRHQEEMAAQQGRMVAEQDKHNFHSRVLATLPLLKDEEKKQFVLDQLLPKIAKKRLSWDVNRMQRSEILKKSGLFEFASSYSEANPTIKEFFVASKPWNAARFKLRALQAELEGVENERFEDKIPTMLSWIAAGVVFFIFLILFGVVDFYNESVHKDISNDSIEATLSLLAFGGPVIAFLFLGRKIKKVNVEKEASFQKDKQAQIEALKSKIKSLGNIEEIWKTRESIWGKIKDQFVEDYMNSASGKEFAGEQGGRRLLVIATNPWREIVAEQQIFLPPSARPSFDEHWLPLLIREDKMLRKAVAYLEKFQVEMKEVFIKFIHPDFDKQAIIIKPDKEFTEDGDGEDIIEECIKIIRSEQKASVSLLQRQLRLGYTHATRIMDELEGRGIVGPSKGAEPRDILINLDS
ncbi:MAG TPA: DNA translocase FtsK [Verrucomicrobiae bacterium]|nr:DNA translocase FtsK [Verrucomicrobiae bacterium]